MLCKISYFKTSERKSIRVTSAVSALSLEILNFVSRPETLGRKNGAAFGFLGGSFGLLRD